MNVVTWVPGTSAHSWQAVAAGGLNLSLYLCSLVIGCLIKSYIPPMWTQNVWTRFHISFLNHFPNLKLVNDGGTVGMKEAPTFFGAFIQL